MFFAKAEAKAYFIIRFSFSTRAMFIHFDSKIDLPIMCSNRLQLPQNPL